MGVLVNQPEVWHQGVVRAQLSKVWEFLSISEWCGIKEWSGHSQVKCGSSSQSVSGVASRSGQGTAK